MFEALPLTEVCGVGRKSAQAQQQENDPTEALKLAKRIYGGHLDRQMPVVV